MGRLRQTVVTVIFLALAILAAKNFRSDADRAA
jgi:hypothetical protein